MGDSKRKPVGLVWVKARGSDHVVMLQGRILLPFKRTAWERADQARPGARQSRETPVWGTYPGALRAPGCRLLGGGRCSPPPPPRPGR